MDLRMLVLCGRIAAGRQLDPVTMYVLSQDGHVHATRVTLFGGVDERNVFKTDDGFEEFFGHRSLFNRLLLEETGNFSRSRKRKYDAQGRLQEEFTWGRKDGHYVYDPPGSFFHLYKTRGTQPPRPA